MMNKLIAWLSDIALSAIVAIMITAILNTLVGILLENDVFGNNTPIISELWPEIMVPAGILLGIYFLVQHAPNRY